MSSVAVVFREPDEEEVRVLRWLQRMVLRHPVAAQAAFRWLVAEGRRFAGTAEGAAWQRRLTDAAFVDRARLVWESASFGMFDPSADEPVPEAVVEVLIALAARGDLESFLSRWFLGEAGTDAAP